MERLPFFDLRVAFAKFRGLEFKDYLAKKVETMKVIENEYGELYTSNEFMKIIEDTPIQFTDSIGRIFC